MHTFIIQKVLQPFKCSSLIRLGKDNDGGYIVNEQDVKQSKQLVSFGIKDDWSFEKDFLNINNIPLNAYDKDAEPDDDFYEFFSGSRKHMFKNVGNKTDEISLLDVVTEPNTFLKCDIEGGEYSMIDDLINISHLLSGMVIELHELNMPDKFFESLNLVSKIYPKLVHLHINNWSYAITPDKRTIPNTIELSFSSAKDLKYDSLLELPHRLDMPNNPNDKEFKAIFL